MAWWRDGLRQVSVRMRRHAGCADWASWCRQAVRTSFPPVISGFPAGFIGFPAGFTGFLAGFTGFACWFYWVCVLSLQQQQQVGFSVSQQQRRDDAGLLEEHWDCWPTSMNLCSGIHAALLQGSSETSV